METFNSLLFNVVVIVLPICIFEMYDLFGTERRRKHLVIWARGLLALTNSLIALFCMTHQIEVFGGVFDLRLLPFLVSFIYGSAMSGGVVAAVIIIYQFLLVPDGFSSTFLAFGIIYPLCIAISFRPAWRNQMRLTHPLLLTGICLAVLLCIRIPFTLLHISSIRGQSWSYFFVYNAVHLVTMWIISLLIEHMRINAMMRQKLFHSEKLSMLSELAAAVAHEIRNPMTVARGFMQLLSRTDVTEDKKQAYTGMVIEEIDRAEKIITDYLSFAKPQALQVRPLDLKDAVERAQQLIAPYASARGVQLISVTDDPPMPMLADMERLVQCIVNVCKHGIDAMPSGGELRLRLQEIQLSYTIEVKDDGIGMTEEEISRLGTPYYAMDTEGTGLSMMVAFRIVESLGGQIQVRSRHGQGSTFMISFARLQP